MKAAFPLAALALALGAITGALVLPAALRSTDNHSLAGATPSGWSEVPWPFPADQFGRGKAYQCGAADCGTPVTLYVRAKIGFCNCATGVADDAELERIGDLELLGGKSEALGDGRAIAVAWMKGRSRPYALVNPSLPGESALSVGYNDRCDAIVATAVMQHDRPRDAEPAVIEFLNGPTVMRWAEVTLGL
ncbi:MAG: hypothetical protein K2Y71_11965 [Xanthobacteraceae bacterium]|nr:hypothetical protein [Xanthobacteraceae bacterium]